MSVDNPTLMKIASYSCEDRIIKLVLEITCQTKMSIIVYYKRDVDNLYKNCQYGT